MRCVTFNKFTNDEFSTHLTTLTFVANIILSSPAFFMVFIDDQRQPNPIDMETNKSQQLIFWFRKTQNFLNRFQSKIQFLYQGFGEQEF